MKNTLTILLISGIMVGCSSLGALLPGPKVAANVQAGKENTQQIVGNQERIEGENVEVNKVSGSKVEVREIAGGFNQTINTIPPWVILLLIVGWLLPSPSQMWNNFLELIHGRKKKNGS